MVFSLLSTTSSRGRRKQRAMFPVAFVAGAGRPDRYAA